MKHFYPLLLVALLFARPISAQTTDPVREKLDLIFANLDKSQVPTGRLVEAAVPLAPLLNFDGAVLRDTGRADLDNFRHLYATALSSRLYGTETLPTLPVFNQRVLAASPVPGGAIPVAVQYIRYARLRSDAETAGLVTLQNEQLYDVSGRTQSPYQTAVLFAAAPERAYAPTNTVSLVLSSALYLASDAPNTAPSLSLDFGDGQGYRPAAWDQPLSTTYATAGTKRVKVKLVYTSDTRESWFDLTVFSAAPAYRTTTTAEYVFTQTVSGPFRADYTDHLGAKVTVRFSPNHTSIIKPFIVVEGYNTATIAPHLVGQNNQNNTIGQFLDNITNPFTSPFDLYNSLQQADYDIVYIDFTVGTDDIRRNAALFQEVVVWVNQQKQLTGSTQSNVVMGESMGGLVARYGLARLARNGYNSQTRLLVLHDSPQRGANNPMGLQALTRQADFPVAFLPGNYNGNSNFVRTSDLSDKLKEALAVLDAPATKQLSLKNVTGTDGQYDENTFIDGPYKTMVDFADIGGTPAGFPPIIATSDGSQCGRAQNTPPYQELTRNNQEYILGFAYILRGGIQSEAIANALPAYGTQRTIAHLRVWMTLRVLGGTYTSTLLKRDYPSPANTLPYETLPGGTTNLSEQQDLTGKPIRNTIGFWHFANNTSLYNGDICFVPTYSALDVATVTSATAYAKYINGVTDNPSSPRVASYIAQESVNGSGTQFNQAHIRFTARNSEWLFSKMQNLTLPSSYCSTECDPGANLAISGPITLCGTGTYTSPLQGPNYSYSWAASPAGAFTVSSGTGPTFQTANVTGVNTPGTITLTINTGCQVSFTKAIVIGAPAVPAFVQRDPSDMCYSGTAYYTTTNYDPALTYTIRATGATAIRDPGGFRLKHTGSGYVSFTVTATNSCGTQTANGEVTFDCASAFTYAVYPNPAANTLTVKQNNRAGAAPHNSGKFTVRLHDNHGTLHVQKAANTATLQLAVDTLPAGFYLLRIESEGEAPESHQIQITH